MQAATHEVACKATAAVQGNSSNARDSAQDSARDRAQDSNNTQDTKA